jgi:IclR helix-turn-helix domain.
MEKMVDGMPKERDSDSGQFTQTATDGDVMDHVQETGGVATAELAEAFDVTRPTAYRWLCDLEEEGEVSRREVGSNLLWLPVE